MIAEIIILMLVMDVTGRSYHAFPDLLIEVYTVAMCRDVREFRSRPNSF
jgi:hypothetical protein